MVDHQVVAMEFEGGATATLTMNAFNKGGRFTRIYGTKGEIYAKMSDAAVTLYEFETGKKSEILVADAVADQEITGGHGGGDRGIMRTFCEFICGTYNGNSITDISTSIENHLVTFAAERSRREGSVVTIEEYIEELKN
jgi:predicted dehydrogenase